MSFLILVIFPLIWYLYPSQEKTMWEGQCNYYYSVYWYDILKYNFIGIYVYKQAYRVQGSRIWLSVKNCLSVSMETPEGVLLEMISHWPEAITSDDINSIWGGLNRLRIYFTGGLPYILISSITLFLTSLVQSSSSLSRVIFNIPPLHILFL